ncbi:MAG: ATP-binding protein [Promethearchaeota archaeon]
MGIISGGVKLAGCAIGTLIGAYILRAVILGLNPFMHIGLQGLGYLAAVGLIGIGLFSGVLSGKWEILFKYTGPAALVTMFAILVVSIPMSIINAAFPGLPSYLVLGISVSVVVVVGTIAWSYRSGSFSSSQGIMQLARNTLSISNPIGGDLLGAVEITEIPQDYLLRQTPVTDTWEFTQPFLNLLLAVLQSGNSIGVRLERVNRRMRLLLLVRAHNWSALQKNIANLKIQSGAYLGSFIIREHPTFVSGINIADRESRLVTITGEPLTIEDPRQTINGLTGIAETLQQMDNGIVQVWIEPARGSSIQKWRTKRELQSELEKSQSSRSVDEHTRTQYDIGATQNAKFKSSELRRQQAHIGCKVYVNVVSWDTRSKQAESASSQLGLALSSSILPSDERKGFCLTPSKKLAEIEQVIKGLPVGKATFMHPTEALPFFMLPRSHAGLGISKRQSFSTAFHQLPSARIRFDSKGEIIYTKQRPADVIEDRWWRYDPEEYILLGFPLRANGTPDIGNPVWTKASDLRGHLGIFGTTGSGKTWTSLCVVAQMVYTGLKPIIVVPYKVREWRLLRALFPDIRIFTAGDPNTAPFVINFWEPPTGVSLTKWIARLADVFHAWLPNEDVITMHFKNVIHRTYQICGWNAENGTRGRPILLSDLHDAIEYYIENDLGYGDEVSRNFAGALRARIKSVLMEPEMVRMFNTKGGLTFQELLEKPAIIEMEELTEIHAELLTGIITAGISEYRSVNPVSTIENVLVLEEAHVLLKRVARRTDGEQSATEVAIDNLVRMLRVAGGNGLGLILIDQLPGLLVEEAIKIPKSVIAHKLRYDEIQLVGDLVRCDEDQRDHIGGLNQGEAIVLIDGHGIPLNVQVFRLDEILVDSPYGRTLSNENIAAVMKPLFETHADKFASEPLPEHILEILKLQNPKEEVAGLTEPSVDLETSTKLRSLVMLDGFAKSYSTAIHKAANGEMQYVVQLLLGTANVLRPTKEQMGLLGIEVFRLAREKYGMPREDAFCQEIMGATEGALKGRDSSGE